MFSCIFKLCGGNEIEIGRTEQSILEKLAHEQYTNAKCNEIRRISKVWRLLPA